MPFYSLFFMSYVYVIVHRMSKSFLSKKQFLSYKIEIEIFIYKKLIFSQKPNLKKLAEVELGAILFVIFYVICLCDSSSNE